mmetsp:Transcript_21318/g.54585  ORF Transcript_21318/g.54585 Transcript_21318/m.54585 type:complete len:99 (+) Transcript_21318:217-513(+)
MRCGTAAASHLTVEGATRAHTQAHCAVRRTHHRARHQRCPQRRSLRVSLLGDSEGEHVTCGRGATCRVEEEGRRRLEDGPVSGGHLPLEALNGPRTVA